MDVTDNLHEKTSDVGAFQEVIRNATVLLDKTEDEMERQFLLGTLGNLNRIIGVPEKAITHLTESLAIARETKDVPREIAALIRLGEAVKYALRQNEALALFDEALEKGEGEAHKYMDFALQHKGKCLLELERYEEAENSFLEALRLRKEKGDQPLIDSTQLAIDFVENK